MTNQTETKVNPGDRARLIKVPDDIVDAELKKLFEQCLGQVFQVGYVDTLIALDIGELSGRKSYMESIYVEPDCIELVSRYPHAPLDRSG